MKASDEYKVGSLEDAIRFSEERNYQYDQPVCYAMLNKDGSIYDVISCKEHDIEEGEYIVPLYRHPVKDLTDEEIYAEMIKCIDSPNDGHEFRYKDFARAILRKAEDK